MERPCANSYTVPLDLCDDHEQTLERTGRVLPHLEHTSILVLEVHDIQHQQAALPIQKVSEAAR